MENKTCKTCYYNKFGKKYPCCAVCGAEKYNHITPEKHQEEIEELKNRLLKKLRMEE